MSLRVPPAQASDFPVGGPVVGVVKHIAKIGVFAQFLYAVGRRQCVIDGLLPFDRTPRPEVACGYRYDEIRVVVTAFHRVRQILEIALPADPQWLTADVVALARGIRAERALDRMPILADALEEAGCADPAVLHHCRTIWSGEFSWLIPLLTGYGPDAGPGAAADSGA
jgi:hypothetical protein